MNRNYSKFFNFAFNLELDGGTVGRSGKTMTTKLVLEGMKQANVMIQELSSNSIEHLWTMLHKGCLHANLLLMVEVFLTIPKETLY